MEPNILECFVKKDGRRGVRKRWQEWKQLEGEDICCLLTTAATEHLQPRRLHSANRDSYKLFTPGPHCGHFPCGASLHGAPGSWRAWAGCQRQNWRLEMALFPNTQPDVLWVFAGHFEEKRLIFIEEQKVKADEVHLRNSEESKICPGSFLMVWVFGGIFFLYAHVHSY